MIVSNTETRLKNLPFIPARIREFAYRYALQCEKTRQDWAREFNVKCGVIGRWLNHNGVKDYIAIIQGAARKGESYLDEIKRKLRGTRDKMMYF